MTLNSWQEFRAKAAGSPKKIVLADGEDVRVVKAALSARDQHIAEPTLVGSKATIEKQIRAVGGKGPLGILDLASFSATEKQKYLTTLQGLPKYRSLSSRELADRLEDPLVLGCLALKMGQAEGFIGGAARTTADTLRAAFSIVGLAPKTSTLFGFFLLESRVKREGSPLVLLADCAVTPEPSPKQLAAIGVHGAAAYEFFTGDKARVAFLSFSTQGSANHPLTAEVKQALLMAREMSPSLDCEGEWQADAALDAFTAGIKGVGSSALAGKVNVLVAPDLNTGNIAYKLVQRLGGCRAVGPVLWGMALPANDLSRGCSEEDVLDMMALTVLQAQSRMSATRPFTNIR